MTRPRKIAIASAAALVIASILIAAYLWTRPGREALRTLVSLMNAANRGDLDEARTYCTARYLAAHPLISAPEGGVAGLPRGIHKNFQIWNSGPNVRICPTNRQGPVYQFAFEDGRWKFDGLVGMIRYGQMLMTDGDAASP